MEKHEPFGHSKEDNIERKTYEEENRRHEESFARRMHSPEEDDKWMQHATKHPGATREYLRMRYGDKAFNEDGSIKMKVLDVAIKHAKEKHNILLEKRLVLARTYKEKTKKKERVAYA